MRVKDLTKVAAIKTAVYDIVNEEGYQNLSMSKVAKRAGISQAAIYLTYDSKEAMLTSLYVEARDMLANHTPVNTNPEVDIEQELKQLFTNYTKTVMAHPKQALFMNVVNNTPSLVTASAYQAMMAHNQGIHDLLMMGKRKGVLKDVPETYLSAFSFFGLNNLLQVSYDQGKTLNDVEIATAVEMAWEAIKK